MAEEEKKVDGIDEKMEELKKAVEEGKDELKTKKGFKAFAKKWSKILAVPFLILVGLIVAICKGWLFKGSGDDDELMTDEAQEETETAA